MYESLASLIPVYLLILLGFVAVRSRLFLADGLPHISRFVLVICIPVLIASAVSGMGSLQNLNWQFIAGYGIGSVAVVSFGALAIQRFFGIGPGRSWVLAIGMGNSNSLFLGLPIALIVMPDLVDRVASWVVMVENLIVIPLAMTVADVVARTHRHSFLEAVRSTLGRMATNPVIIGLSAGLVLAAVNPVLPKPLEHTRELIVAAAPVLALFAVGGNIAQSRITDVGAPAILIAFSKLVLHPALVFALLSVLPGVSRELAFGGLLFACMPMLASYPIFASRHDGQDVASSSLVIATLAGAITVGAVVYFLR